MRDKSRYLEVIFLVIASLIVLYEATTNYTPTSAELSAGRVATYYGLLAGGFVLIFGALVEWRFLELREQIADLEQRLYGTPQGIPPMRAGLTTREWAFRIFGGALAVAGGILVALSLPLNKPDFVDAGLGAAAVGIGLLAMTEAWMTSRQTTAYLQEIRRGEIDEKIATMYAYGGSRTQKIVSDLRALESIAGSITTDQASRIETEGRRIVATELSSSPSDAAEGREVLNRILAPHNKTI